MKMYICKLCTANQMLIQSKFCLIIVQKPITAFARIHPHKDSADYPDAGYTLRPLQPPTIFFAPPPLLPGWLRQCLLSDAATLRSIIQSVCMHARAHTYTAKVQCHAAHATQCTSIWYSRLPLSHLISSAFRQPAMHSAFWTPFNIPLCTKTTSRLPQPFLYDTQL